MTAPSCPRILVVTGTGTDVGKTVVTAAIAAVTAAQGRTVAVLKPAQTGLGPGKRGDVHEVGRLSGVTDLHEIARYPDPLAPATAARRARRKQVTVRDVVAYSRGLADRDLVLIEGAGGALVQLDGSGATLLDVAAALQAPVLVVTSAGLGALNSLALTAEAIGSRGLTCPGFVIGSWPREPDLAARTNVADAPGYARAPLLGALPAGAGILSQRVFLSVARAGLGALFGGGFDAADFRALAEAALTRKG